MKNLILCACTIILTTGLFAQKKKNEVVINFGSSNSYALSYKFGTTKSLWRFNLLSSNVNIRNSETEEYFSFNEETVNDFTENDSQSIGFSIGREYRNPLANKLEFKYGFDIGLNYANFSNDYNNYNSVNNLKNYYNEGKIFTPSINGIIGFNYVINKNIIVGIEVLPNFSYAITNSEFERGYEDEETANSETKSTNFSFNLDNDTARLSLAYRF